MCGMRAIYVGKHGLLQCLIADYATVDYMCTQEKNTDCCFV